MTGKTYGIMNTDHTNKNLFTYICKDTLQFYNNIYFIKEMSFPFLVVQCNSQKTS